MSRPGPRNRVGSIDRQWSLRYEFDDGDACARDSVFGPGIDGLCTCRGHGPMLTRLSRLADRFSAAVMEGRRDPNALLDDGALHPAGVAVAAIVLAVSVVAFAAATALALDRFIDGALALTIGYVI